MCLHNIVANLDGLEYALAPRNPLVHEVPRHPGALFGVTHTHNSEYIINNDVATSAESSRAACTM